MTRYSVLASRWDGGWELRVDGLGVTQTNDLSRAAHQVCDFVETMLDVQVALEDIEVTVETASVQ